MRGTSGNAFCPAGTVKLSPRVETYEEGNGMESIAEKLDLFPPTSSGYFSKVPALSCRLLLTYT
jgi:hypothetical protein